MTVQHRLIFFLSFLLTLPILSGVSFVNAQSSGAPQIEEVIVYGIQKSLESALEEKREKSNLTEVINAEDIGKLPDENVAEVLENIPGVQITRNAGIGAGVSVRGTDQNRVEINGRGTTPSGDSRGGISFADLPAALVRSLNVVKVPTADMVEGSLGGTINVKTFRGLKLKKPLKVLRYDSEYAENADIWNDKYSATFGKKFTPELGDIGAILTVTYLEKTVREDTLRVTPNIRRIAGPVTPFSQEQFGGADRLPYAYPGFAETNYGIQDRENTALSGSLEWQVNSRFKVFTEGSYSDYEQLDRGQNAGISYGGAVQPTSSATSSDRELDGLDSATYTFIDIAGVAIPILTSVDIGTGIRNSRTDDPATDTATPNDGLRIRTGNRLSIRKTKSYVTAMGGEWADDNFEVKFELNAAASDSSTSVFNTVFQYNDPNLSSNFHSEASRVRIPFHYNIRGGDLEYGPIPGSTGLENLLNPDYYSLNIARDQTSFFDNELYSQKVDFKLNFDDPFWSFFQFGFRTSQRVNERSRESQITSRFPFASLNPAEVPDLSSFLTATPGDFFAFNSGGVYLDNFLAADGLTVNARRDELRSLIGLDVNGIVDPLQGFKVDEKTFAYYVRFDFEGEIFSLPARGNFGFRTITTNQLASGSEVLENSELRAIAFRQEYRNNLPSASLVISPIEKIQIRFGYADILRRPNFGALSPTVQFPLNENTAVRVGDPTLQPTTAKQYDIGIEYYFRKGSALSLGFYIKDIDDVISTDVRFGGICNPRVDPLTASGGFGSCTTSDGLVGTKVNRESPVNLPGGTIKGFELALQHNFNWLPRPFNGFGIIANYAYQDGNRQKSINVPQFLQDLGVEGQLPLNFQGLSKNSYNLTLYFDKPRYRLGGRIRYTYRDSFLFSDSIDIANTLPLYTDDRGILNASMSYRINDTFSVAFSGTNLTKEQTIQRSIVADGPIARERDADRRLSLGIRARL